MAERADCVYNNILETSLPYGGSAQIQDYRENRPQAKLERQRKVAAPCKSQMRGGASQVVSPPPVPRRPDPPARQNTMVLEARPPCPRWHRTALGLGGAGNLLLLGTVAVLGVLVYQRPSQIHGNPATCNGSLKSFRSSLTQNLCEVQNSSAGDSGCRLCPRHWKPQRDKCYWLSDGSKYWSRSQDDCTQRRSHLLVLQDREEMAFIQNIIGDQNPVWIGLNVTSPGKNWTWVDGSPLNQRLFTILGRAEENSCAALKRNRIQSEICNTDLKWICQKAAVQL